MKKISTILILILFSWNSQAQQYFFDKKDSVQGNFSSFSVDNFGRITLIREDVILCLSPQLDTLYSTSLKAFRPSSVECSKSFRTLLFDRERSVIHFLDNTMTDIHGEIDLMNLDIQQAWLACESFAGNTIWVFDAGSMRLVKLDANLNTIMVTENLASVFTSDIFPEKMMESNDRLFISVPQSGIVVFDVFGTYLQTYKTTSSLFDVHTNFLWLYEDDKIYAIDLKDKLVAENFIYSVKTATHILPALKNVKQFKLVQNTAYYLTDYGLMIGAYKQE